jgi:hypothetical protein
MPVTTPVILSQPWITRQPMHSSIVCTPQAFSVRLNCVSKTNWLIRRLFDMIGQACLKSALGDLFWVFPSQKATHTWVQRKRQWIMPVWDHLIVEFSPLLQHGVSLLKKCWILLPTPMLKLSIFYKFDRLYEGFGTICKTSLFYHSNIWIYIHILPKSRRMHTCNDWKAKKCQNLVEFSWKKPILSVI